jgi:cysteine sulfinate desulfinase/cysteine desulfurase-like protein
VPAKRSAPHFLSVCFPGRDGAYLSAVLDEAGVSASPSAACRAASGEAAQGYPDQACARSSARFTVPPGLSPRVARRVARAAAHAALLAALPGGRVVR